MAVVTSIKVENPVKKSFHQNIRKWTLTTSIGGGYKLIDWLHSSWKREICHVCKQHTLPHVFTCINYNEKSAKHNAPDEWRRDAPVFWIIWIFIEIWSGWKMKEINFHNTKNFRFPAVFPYASAHYRSPSPLESSLHDMQNWSPMHSISSDIRGTEMRTLLATWHSRETRREDRARTTNSQAVSLQRAILLVT